MKILFKYPSRGRPDRFFKSLDSILNNLQDTESYLISLTLDYDDPLMNNEDIMGRLLKYQANGAKIETSWGYSTSKVNAINRDLPEYGDIIIVMSDDMLFTFFGFDTIIRQEIGDGLDCLIHIPDNDAKHALATMYIAGRPYYNRFGYIYHPSYKSLHCDNEVQDIAQMTGRYKFVNFPGLIFHGNPAYGHLPKDQMFIDQQAIGWTEDHENYKIRKAKNFDL